MQNLSRLQRRSGKSAHLFLLGAIDFHFKRFTVRSSNLPSALAFSFLSLLYSTVAVIVGLIWIPQAITSERGTLSLGLSAMMPIAAAVLAVLVGLALSLPSN